MLLQRPCSLLTRLCTAASDLEASQAHCDPSKATCRSGEEIETREHMLLHCPRYNTA